MRKLLFAGALLCSAIALGQTIALEEVGADFVKPTEIANAGDSRLFIVQQEGLIRILNPDGSVNEDPFLDVSSLVSYDGNEQGLSGMVFHPDYSQNGIFFISYTDVDGDNAIVKYTVSANPDVADATSAETILSIDQPGAVHNSGCMRFGPGGYLYIAIGDGGEWEDPNSHAQNLDLLLGKILRIDVDNGSPYSIPADNPFVGTDGADEIWAYGFRNPWKFNFDADGNIWIADVGQGIIEEVNKSDAATGGLNYGWRCYEGNDEFNTDGCVAAEEITWPVVTYNHYVGEDFFGCSVTGGYVYEGSMYPALQGMYLFADYCNNKIGMVNSSLEVTWSEAFDGNFFATFGKDNNGELYIAGNASGKVYKIIDSTAATDTFSGSVFKVYPNPANDVVTIQAGNGIQPESITVYDMSGKLLIENKISDSDNTFTVSGLPSGLYLLQVKGSNDAVYNHKLSVK
ncbi:T9SS type A sorting domain-containing protein [Flavobacterium salilacus subsp. salilacus]|uniref:PQQ-dependent sugar dehydrogenase n=1 Tax=Flavobacterium TaxID=237 RepID=UPI001074C58A|nr:MULTISPECIES: PQQ-dependent sugar dehydrogenase [Flavobacterium]KAF2518856.1 T9SS type A sorting domain-containing protein [Flavobacterium salilacus subsp. salilacus]MBE1614984.1 PQQ-dependent sugar dehydrogenase [Flavobacterium sp. SaA2.13]